jgi:hypothetical protein
MTTTNTAVEHDSPDLVSDAELDDIVGGAAAAPACCPCNA